MANSKLTAASEVQFLKGVGPARAELLASRGIRTVEDLLYYTPFRYENRTSLTRIRDLVPGQATTVFAKVLTCGLMRTRSGMYIYDLAASDTSGMFRCKWFNATYLEKNKVFHSGQQVFFYGKVDRDRSARARCRWSSRNLKSCRRRRRKAATLWKWAEWCPSMNPSPRWGRAYCGG